ncbi:MAG: biotin transporter BioY [Ruminococcaceae bacterium]|nr:biotin transporter BioY [Oscillospiraceae bacterium]
MEKHRLRGPVLISLFAAVISVLSVVSIPLAVPITLSTLGIFIALGTLGGTGGSLAVMLYVFIGALGLPVFAGFGGGIGHIMGAGGGFIIGYLAAAFIYSTLEFIFRGGGKRKIVYFLVSQITIYLCGTLWFVYVYGEADGFFAALTVTCLPFVIPDAIKILVAYYVSKRLCKLNYTLN